MMAKFDQRIDGVFLGDASGCRALASVSADFQSLIRSQCPLCNGSGATCLVENLRNVVAEGRVLKVVETFDWRSPDRAFSA